MNGSTGTVVDPNGPSTSKDDSVRDKKVLGGRGMGVAPGYDDLAGVEQNPRLHVDHARRVPALIVSSAEKKGRTSWKTKELTLSLRVHGRLRQIQEERRCSVRLMRSATGSLVSPLQSS